MLLLFLLLTIIQGVFSKSINSKSQEELSLQFGLELQPSALSSPDLQDINIASYPIFQDRLYLEGNWAARDVSLKSQFDYFNNENGIFKCVLLQDRSSYNYIIVEPIDGNYIDQKVVQTMFNLSDPVTTFDEKTSTFTYQNATDIDLFNGFNFQSTKKGCDVSMTLQILDKSGKPFDLTSKSVDDVQVIFQASSHTAGCIFGLTTTAKFPIYEILMPCCLLALALFTSLGSISTIYNIWKEQEIFFFNNASPLSLATLTVLNFQLFGAFMLLGMNYTPQYFQYLTVAGINCFFASAVTNKLAFLFFVTQNNHHPRINEQGMRSPKMRFYMNLLGAELVSFIGVFVFVSTRYYGWYVLIFYLYPLIHVVNAIRKGTRNHFRWYYQMMLWIAPMGFPFFIRGYKNNFLKLTPEVLPPLIIMGLVVFFTLFSMIQHYCGTRFFIPKSCIPGLYKYKIAISKLTPEQIGESCSICLFDLQEDPCFNEESDSSQTTEGNENKTELIKKNKYVFKTPCNHIFHSVCLKNWLKRKMNCPACRTKLPEAY